MDVVTISMDAGSGPVTNGCIFIKKGMKHTSITHVNEA